LLCFGFALTLKDFEFMKKILSNKMCQLWLSNMIGPRVNDVINICQPLAEKYDWATCKRRHIIADFHWSLLRAHTFEILIGPKIDVQILSQTHQS
jgi:hypothetical protein